MLRQLWHGFSKDGQFIRDRNSIEWNGKNRLKTVKYNGWMETQRYLWRIVQSGFFDDALISSKLCPSFDDASMLDTIWADFE